MRKLLTLSLVLVLSACGQHKLTIQTGSTTTTITINANPINSALADVQSCPSGMNLMPAGVGYGAFCIDSAPNGVQVSMITAAVACAQAQKVLCSNSQLHVACIANDLNKTQGPYFTSDVGAGAGTIQDVGYDPTGCAGPGSWNGGMSNAFNMEYVCCSR